jgi:hypothetical protein
LKDEIRSGGDRKSKSRSKATTLIDMGVSRDQSSKWQKLITESLKDIELLEALDDWFENKKNNPFRKENLIRTNNNLLWENKITESLEDIDLIEALDDWFESNEQNPFRKENLNNIMQPNCCPKCNSTDIIPVVYGLPAQGMREAQDRGEVLCGGCVVGNDSPTQHCNTCEHRWKEFQQIELFEYLKEEVKAQFVETEKDAAIAYAKAWNRLDYTYLENYLAVDVVNESQYVLEPVKGKTNYIKFIKSKMANLKTRSSDYRVFVQLANVRDSLGIKRDCVVLAQGDEQYLVLFETQNGKIKRIDLCLVPNHDSALKTEYYPGTGRGEN